MVGIITPFIKNVNTLRENFRINLIFLIVLEMKFRRGQILHFDLSHRKQNTLPHTITSPKPSNGDMVKVQVFSVVIKSSESCSPNTFFFFMLLFCP